jgi:hypothetical protein
MEAVIRYKRKAKAYVREMYGKAVDMYDERMRPDVKVARDEVLRNRQVHEAEVQADHYKMGFQKSYAKRQMQAYRAYRVNEPEIKPSLL